MNKISEVKKLINDVEYILIGAGAGLSTAAGIEYSGKRFTDNFEDFIKKYNFTDMYTSSFYDFKTEEEKWAYWAKHIYVNNTGMEATELYKKLFDLIKDKNYFVITTNVDDQFYKTGFDKDKIFATQGSYRYIQCGIACHNKLYDAKDLVAKMLENTHDCKIPSELVPVCPVCGETMDVNIRKDAYFVEYKHWYKQDERYGEFLDTTKNKNVLLLELGVGFNTPGIIRIPFEQMTYKNPNWKLVRINKDDCRTFLDIEDRSILIEDDISEIVEKIAG